MYESNDDSVSLRCVAKIASALRTWARAICKSRGLNCVSAATASLSTPAEKLPAPVTQLFPAAGSPYEFCEFVPTDIHEGFILRRLCRPATDGTYSEAETQYRARRAACAKTCSGLVAPVHAMRGQVKNVSKRNLRQLGEWIDPKSFAQQPA